MFVATTQQTAGWLLEKRAVRQAICNGLRDGSIAAALRKGQFAEGAFRASIDKGGTVLALINRDYGSDVSTGGVGFVKIQGEHGLLSVPDLFEEVFERALFVVSQRLRGLIFESKYFHQSFPDGGHKVLAGRGTDPRDFSIGYIEPQFEHGNAMIRTVLCVGPERDWHKAAAAAVAQQELLPGYCETAIPLLMGRTQNPTILPKTVLAELRKEIVPSDASKSSSLRNVTRRTRAVTNIEDRYRTLGWTYDQWISDDSPLSDEQRAIVFEDGILAHPLRLIGPAGSGKTLLMQLMALRRLVEGERAGSPVSVLYLTHNNAMSQNVYERFHVLGAQRWLQLTNPRLSIRTLSSLMTELLHLGSEEILEDDAGEAKEAQLDEVLESFLAALDKNKDAVYESPVLSAMANEPLELLEFVRAEFSIAIKGNNKWNDRPGYIGSERPLAKLHSLLKPEERAVVFDAFEVYQARLDAMGSFDADDVAITLLNRLRSPLWRKQRKTLGYDFIFVDEAQLFNENEQRVFSYLSKGRMPHVPVALALDEAQQFYGEPKVGLASLGIEDVQRQSLSLVQRMSESIARLAFFVISKSTALFDPDFPDFTESELESSPASQDSAPTLIIRDPKHTSMGRAIFGVVRALRLNRHRHIAIICHAEKYWPELFAYLKDALSDLDFSVLVDRGQRLDPAHNYTVLARPEHIGGQEFDAVICVGLEEGVVPRKTEGAPQLEEALYQQALREMYLAFSRARRTLYVLNDIGTRPTPILQEALEQKYLRIDPASAQG